ncbi:TPR repeat containing protein [Achlya hypogyna]|uniref:TPR repeat containing protein n=1 Tax=Achlya hypogyna TaxID=1202772 RepID=A0A1V9YNA7_ACHHY|nr:TPR repeat containing protein [Achlya hypogyna]
MTLAPTPPHPFGVTLGFFRHLIDLCGGRTKLQGRTTAQVCFDYIVPLTASTQLSLVDHIAADPATTHFVQPANWYISHAWSYLFLETVDSLEVFFAQQQLSDEAVVWFCVFNNNQHRAATYPFEYWSSTFKSQLSAIGNVVMVMHPWNDPVVLRRSWCVFEVYVAVTTGARFEMAMAPDQLELLLNDMKKTNVFNAILSTIKSEQSSTTVPSDRDGIFALIEAETSFTAVDRLVFSTISDWMKRALTTHAVSLASPEEQEPAWRSLHDLYGATDKWVDAERCAEQVVACCESIHGVGNATTLFANTLVLTSRAKANQPLEVWEQPFETLIEQLESVLGRAHPDVIEARVRFASELVSRGLKNERAIELLFVNSECLGSMQPDDHATLRTALPLGQAHCNLNHFDDAEHWFGIALASARRVHPPEHPFIVSAEAGLGDLYHLVGRLDEALAIFEIHAELHLRRYGIDDYKTVAAFGVMGTTLHRMGKLVRARSHFTDLLNALAKRPPRQVVNTIISQEGLALVHWALDDKAAAVALLLQCIKQFLAHDRLFRALRSTERLYRLLIEASVDGADDAWVPVHDHFVAPVTPPESWTSEYCAGCHQDIVGTLTCCNMCPRGTYFYCRLCSTLGRILCAHDTSAFLAFKPPHRHLLEEKLASFNGPLDAFDEALAHYTSYCRDHSVPEDEQMPRVVFGYEVDSRPWHPML